MKLTGIGRRSGGSGGGGIEELREWIGWGRFRAFERGGVEGEV
jgi:hypothetical protein